MSVDQSFEAAGRSYPSPQPIRSPSPDPKGSYVLTSTVTPSVIKARRHQTHNPTTQSPGVPHRSGDFNEQLQFLRDENYSLRRELQSLQKHQPATGHPFSANSSFEMGVSRLRDKVNEQQRLISKFRLENQQVSKVNSSLQKELGEEQLQLKLREKDHVINELKKVVASMSEDISQSRAEPVELREKLCTLEMENARLAEMVRKLNKKENIDKIITENKTLSEKVELLATENRDLQDRLTRIKRGESQEITDLIKVNNALTQQLKNYAVWEKKLANLEDQNSRLLKLVRDSKESQTYLEEQVQRLQAQLAEAASAPIRFGSTSSVVSSSSNDRISKIKDQYNESLKVFKENVAEDVNNQMHHFGNTLLGMTNRIDSSMNRVVALERQLSRISELQKQLKQSTIPKQVVAAPQPATLTGSNVRPQPPSSRTPIQDLKAILQLKERQFREAQLALEEQLDHEKELGRSASEKYNQLVASYNLVKQAETQKLNEISVLLAENSRQRDQISALNQRIAQLAEQTKLPVAPTPSPAPPCGHEGVIASLKDQVASLQSQLKVQKEQTESLKNQLVTHHKDEVDKIVTQHREELDQLRTLTEQQVTRVVSSFDREIEELNKQLAERKQIADNLTVQLQDARNAVSTSNLALHEAKIQTQKVEDQLKQKTQQVESLQKAIEALKTDNQHLRQDLNRAHVDVLNQTEILREQTNKALDDANQAKNDAIVARDKAVEDARELESRIEQLTSQVATLNTINQRYSSEIDSIEISRNTLVTQKAEALQSQQTLKQQIARLTSEIQGLTAKLAEAEKALQNERRSKDFSKLLEELDGFPLEETLQKVLEALNLSKAQNHSLQMNLKDASAAAELAKIQQTRLNQRVIELNRELQQKEAELVCARAALESRQKESRELSDLLAGKYEGAESKEAERTEVLESVVLIESEQRECDKLSKMYRSMVAHAHSTLGGESAPQPFASSESGIKMSESITM